MEQFYKIYGEFFAVWKLWDDAIQQNSGKRDELFERIAAAEAQLEALIVRISCQRALTEDEIHVTGAFRQAYQTLRKCMKHGQSLSGDHGWNASNATPYAAWLAGVTSLGDAGLARPCGPAEGPFAESPMARLVLHINREALHHGAEIALLRDLYANR